MSELSRTNILRSDVPREGITKRAILTRNILASTTQKRAIEVQTPRNMSVNSQQDCSGV